MKQKSAAETLSGFDDQLLPLLHFIVSDKITVNLSAIAGDAGYFSPGILFENGERMMVPQTQADPVKYRHGNNVSRIRRRVGIKAHGIEDIPGGHFAAVVHAAQGQAVFAHAVETIHDVVQYRLGFFLFADKIVEVGITMVRLVALAILADKTVDVHGKVVGVPGNAEQPVQLLLKGRLAGI